MAQLQFSGKRIQIDKANLTIVIVMSVACFVTVFSLVAAKGLLQQRSYQTKVITEKEKARDQLKKNLAARDKLVEQYKLFVDSQTNVIGGSTTGTGEKDGDNAKIILDALPSKYDFPALATSVNKLVGLGQVSLKSIGGTDNELQQTSTDQQESTPVEIPIDVSAEGSTEQVQKFLKVLNASIRPVQVRSLSLSGADDKLTITVSGTTYYQPEVKLTIKQKVIK